MTDREIRWGIVGCGMMGREHLANLDLIDEAKVLAIYEPNDEQAQLSLALTPFARREASLDLLLVREDIDAVLIASPNHTHAEILDQVMASRPRAILCEKPIVTNQSQVERLTAAEARWQKPFWVAMEYRYMPPVAKLVQRIHSGDIGALQMLTIREHRFPFLEKIGDWNRFNHQTGGTLVEKCCHFFDLMRLIMQAEPQRIMASAGLNLNHADELYNGCRPDIWDNGYVILDFPGNRRAMLELCMFAEGAYFQEEITAVGDKARLDCCVPGPSRFWPKKKERPAELIFSPRDPKGPVREIVDVDPTILRAGDHHGSTYFQHLKFKDAVLYNQPVEVSLSDGLRAVAMGLAAQQAAATKSVVEL